MNRSQRLSLQLQRLHCPAHGAGHPGREPTIHTRASFTIEPELLEIARANARRRGFGTSFSAYICWLIERDRHGDVAREIVGVEPMAPRKPPKRSKATKPPGEAVLKTAGTKSAAKASRALDS